MGLTLPAAVLQSSGVQAALREAETTAGDVATAATDLETAASADDEPQIITAFAQLAVALGLFYAALDRVVEQVRANVTAATIPDVAARAAAGSFADELAVAISNAIVASAITDGSPQLGLALRLLGLIDWRRIPKQAGNPLSTDHVVRSLALGRIRKLFTDPAAHYREALGWGDAAFDPSDLFALYDSFWPEETGVQTGIAGGEPFLQHGHFRISRDSATNPPSLLLSLSAELDADIERRRPINENWGAGVKSSLKMIGTISGNLTPPLGLALRPPAATISGELRGYFDRNPDKRPFDIIGGIGVLSVSVNNVTAGVGLNASWDVAAGTAAFNPLVFVDLDKVTIRIGSADSDGFISTLLAAAAIEGQVDLGLEWRADSGLKVKASGGIEIALPLHKELGPVRLETLYLALRILSDGTLALEISTALGAQLGPLAVAVERMGIRLDTRFADDADGDLGPLDLSLGFKPPNGVGLAVDAGAVKGGGYLYFDFDKEEYAGAFELVIAGFLTVTAVGLVTTRMPDGSKGFSLLIIITAEFGTGIQIGMGFTLIGVGGLLGLNRTVKLQPLADGVRTGAVNNIMFPKNVVANAPRIISDLRAIFPPFEGKFLIGPMAKLGWGSPPLITLSLGIIIEIPGNLAILGVLKCILPDEKAPVLVLQVAFVGAIEFDKKRLWLFAGIFDSKVLTFTLEGEMGVLFAWGDDADFVLSVGGFHPRFTPPPLPFPSPKRLAISILDKDQARIRVSCYFAVTTNTVQFGARAELFFGFSAISVEGHFQFDALFQFSPFYFIIELGASVSLKVGGMGVFSISLEMALEGPTPWHARGRGSISFFFFDVSANFDETWGEEKDTTLPPIDVFPQLVAELAKEPNWSALPPKSGNLLVSLRVVDDKKEFVLHPVGALRVTQRAVPLNSTIDLFGTQKPADANRFTLAVTTPGLAVAKPVREQFAPAQFHTLSRAEKLAAPAFSQEDGGIDISASGNALRSSLVVRRVVRYEQIIIDTNFKRFVQRFTAFSGTLFRHFLGGNAAARSALSAQLKNQMQPFKDVITTDAESFGVANTSNNTMVAGTTVFGSYHAAKEHMEQAIAQNPGLAGKMHVVPDFELNKAA